MDPKVMMAIAEKESAFRPAVKARGSTAVGLFQLIESTWLETVKAHGPKHGLDGEADAIKVTHSKKKNRTIYSVPNSNMRRHIMNLQKDPYVATLMAGEYIQAARAKLEARTGKAVAQEDVYLPHFLGTNGARRLLEASASKPERAANTVFPRAARANRSIFRNKNHWITIAQLHTKLRGIVKDRMGKYENVAALSGLTSDAKTLGPGPAVSESAERPVILAGLKY
nr:transglycosylase SLT domain-containing protein [Roseibium sp. RKSG952]